MTCVFDTNAISALVHQRRGFERLAARIDSLPLGGRLVSAVTLSEVETMVAKAADPLRECAQVRLVLAHFNIVDFGEAAAFHVGQIRGQLESRGVAIGPLDTLIAGHARSLGATVITDNLPEFSRVPGLRVESWLR